MTRLVLTSRERQVLKLIEHGLNSEEIADALGIDKWTVRDYVRGLAGIFGGRLPDLPRLAREAGHDF